MTIVVRPLRDLVHGLVDALFGIGVDLAGRFVEDEDAREAQRSAGDAESLALPAREPRFAVADEGVVALGEFLDKVVGERGLGGLDDAFLRDAELA